jgi:hypothetical protein
MLFRHAMHGAPPRLAGWAFSRTMSHLIVPGAPARYACFPAWLAALAICSVAAAAGPPSSFDFNGPETTWQVEDAGRVGRVMLQECTTGGARDAAGCERLVVAAPGGESMRLVCPTAPVAVIDELEIRIWVKSNRPDVRLAVRIALPRTVRDGAASAERVIVRGERYERPGQWQQLVLRDVPKQLAAEVRILRSTSQREIDPREAFVDAVVLIVPGEPAGVEVATDDLVVDGVMRTVRDEVRLMGYPTGEESGTLAPASRRPDHGSRGVRVAAEDLEQPNPGDTVRLQGDLLFVSGRPFLPRAIQYRNEPLQSLAERGFNVVWLDRAPTAEEAAQARKLGLWFIGSPPQPETLMREGLVDADDRVIAWFLADVATANDPNYASRWADLVRERDAVSGRPVIVAPCDDLQSGNTAEDIMLAARPRLAFVPADAYERWLTGQLPLVRPGMPLWASFPSQLSLAVGEQIAALSGGTTTAPPGVSMIQLQSQVDVACTHAVRGFTFQSETPLSETDSATRVRANSLELINRRLQRLEPWLASGNMFGRFPSADAAWSGIVLNVDGARLLIPRKHTAAQGPTAAKGRGEVTFVVPGIPDSCQVYLLTPVALKTLPAQRIAGGTRFAFRPDDDVSVLMTEDPNVVQSLRQHIARYGERVVRLLRENAALKTAMISETNRRLTQNGVTSTVAGESVQGAAALLQQVDAALASQRVEQAYESAVAVNHALDQATAELRRAMHTPTALYSNPIAIADERLVEFAAFERARTMLQYGENLLYGGDFEDVRQLTQTGWRHFQGPSPGVESRAELSIEEPRHGSYCLILHAAGSSTKQPERDATSVWIESPPIPVTEGQMVEISGWARVEQHSGQSGSELQIIDSVGGPDAALVIHRTDGWERFHLVRAIPNETELRVTFALAGLGKARLDAVMLRELRQPSSQRLPAIGPGDNTGATSSTPTAAGPLLGSPGATR